MTKKLASLQTRKEFTRLVVYLDKDNKSLLDALKRDAKKYRVSVSAMASFAMQAGLPFVEAHYEKIYSKGKEEVKA